jgi:hypothetical protein
MIEGDGSIRGLSSSFLIFFSFFFREFSCGNLNFIAFPSFNLDSILSIFSDEIFDFW